VTGHDEEIPIDRHNAKLSVMTVDGGSSVTYSETCSGRMTTGPREGRNATLLKRLKMELEFFPRAPHFVRDTLHKPQVLLADDHAGLVHAVGTLLQPDFTVVGTVGDGESLIKAAVELKPDVIVTDISMPILNGIDAAIRLRESGCTSKIVFLTVHGGSDYVRSCLATGAFGYVVKTQLATDLLPAIREVLEGRIFVSPQVRLGQTMTRVRHPI
jgi:CheY-like chemotaxis protein